MRKEIVVVVLIMASAITSVSLAQPPYPSPPPSPPVVKGLEVTAQPGVIPADGVSESTVIATVTDWSGTGPGGFTICFEIVSGPGDVRLYPKCEITNDEGKAYTTLTSGETPGIVTVKACWDEDGRKVCNTTNISLTGPPEITSWYNNITGDDSLEITVRDTHAILFNATADQPIDVWHWFKDGEEVSGWNEPYYITSWPANTHGTHHVSVRAENENGTSSPVTWTIHVEDKTPPPKVTGLRSEILNGTAVKITWDESTAPDLSNYSVYKDGMFYANTTENFIVVTGLSPGVEYQFEVSAWDSHGNEGEKSDVLIVRMPSPPNITEWQPSEYEVMDKEGDSRTFRITVDQIVDVKWFIDGEEVFNESGVSSSEYTATAVVGEHEVRVVAENVTTELSSDHTWRWIVSPVSRGVSLTVEGGKYAEKIVAPNETATYVLTVKNTGERDDTFTLTVDNVNNADVAELDKYEVSLSPGETANVMLTVRDTDEGDYVVNVTARSQSNESVMDSVMTLTKVRAPKPDLIVSEITPNCGHIFANETNNISIKIKNEGVANASAFNVSVRINDKENVYGIEGLNASESTVLNIIDEEKRHAGSIVEITVIVDCDNNVDELNETNNERAQEETVVNNGYKGKRYTGGEDIKTWKTFTLNGSVIYSVGDSRYEGGYDGWPAANYTVNWTTSDLPIPNTAIVKEARLYVPYCFDYGDDVPANISLTFNGVAKTFEAHYTDRKGFPVEYGKYGMLVYNVTNEFNSTSDNTATLTNLNWNKKTVSIRGMLLVVIYADENEPQRTIIMNEEFDMLYGGASQCTTPEEATAYAPFNHMVEDAENKSARLITVAPGADNEGDLIFNGQVWTDVWSFAGATEIGIDDRIVSNLNETNWAAFRSSEDYMEASNAILVIEAVTIRVVPLPDHENPPTDPDNDGLYEDINGNGRKDFADVTDFFEYLEWIEKNEPTNCFDFNNNGRIDFNDVVKLFEEM